MLLVCARVGGTLDHVLKIKKSVYSIAELNLDSAKFYIKRHQPLGRDDFLKSQKANNVGQGGKASNPRLLLLARN